jgi:beta-glucosidase
VDRLRRGGLSYTTFRLSELRVSHATSPAAPGPAVTVHCAITNTGARAGADVVQVYVGDPASSGEPPEQLKAFARVPLAPGETRSLTFTLDLRAFAHWDVAASGWVVDAGEYAIGVGDSSVDLPLRAKVALPRVEAP